MLEAGAHCADIITEIVVEILDPPLTRLDNVIVYSLRGFYCIEINRLHQGKNIFVLEK